MLGRAREIMYTNISLELLFVNIFNIIIVSIIWRIAR